MARRLRSGYTTGACAAAAAKAAVQLLVGHPPRPETVEIPFPDGSRHGFAVHQCEVKSGQAWASVIKDAGDDPDVTNGAEIVARVSFLPEEADCKGSLPPGGGGLGRGGNSDEPGRLPFHPPPSPLPSAVTTAREGEPICVRLEQTNIFLCGGAGIGRVTKPGLAVKPGEPAINPVPRRMILAAVLEALDAEAGKPLQVEISVPRGEELAEKTLNKRLGIVGGLSILG
ncbi:MAG: cobalt-precorrin-5B (C(1))-methyltransferase, partial [Desulfurivibrionaceae bacterium]